MSGRPGGTVPAGGTAVLDGNEAVAHVAYRMNEACVIYPITPSSPMAELADQWSAEGRPNLWGNVPVVLEMQSEGGAAGAVHGVLQGGGLATTFTASQGLLLMIPNMYRIAGELSPCVFHVAARSVATHALSIFGDHSDVMATRGTGFALLASASVQEAHDLAAVAQAATLESRVPFLHFFDGFRTSHELNRLEILADDQLRSMVDEAWILGHRERALNPERPVLRGTAQNPDVFFQAREASAPFHARTPEVVLRAMDRLAGLTGRRYSLFDWTGAPDAERILVIMGSGGETARETVEHLVARGEKVGVVQVRLFRPFSPRHLLAAIPATVRRVAVLDRTREPGAYGDPLFLDVVAALAGAPRDRWREGEPPLVVGGRYGLASKEFTPAMVRAVLDHLGESRPRHGFTVGITDDVSGSSLPVDPSFTLEGDDVYRAVFYGLGADGTVGANRSSVRILAEDPELHIQAYFVYDSKKAGSRTVSHLRIGRRPIRAPYLVQRAQFVGCHHSRFLETVDVLEYAAPGSTFLLNTADGPEEVWDRLPRELQLRMLDLDLRLYVVDAAGIARSSGLGRRISTVMQVCFLVLSGQLPPDRALDRVRDEIRDTFGLKGAEVVQRNLDAVERALAEMHAVPLAGRTATGRASLPVVPPEAPPFVRHVTAALLAGRGDTLPVSAFPPDGTFPVGTARWERRNIADQVPLWEPEICIQCGECAFICPHGVIEARTLSTSLLQGAPEGFPSAPLSARGFPGIRYALQVRVEDCTGCTLCVEVCPARRPDEAGRKALHMVDRAALPEAARSHLHFFDRLPLDSRSSVDFSTVRGTQFLEPLFTASGACAGCGETPYLTLLSRLFGDRAVVANATGCSSIYGGNLPTTPWAANREGRGPAWSNSLFEDNAEFGLGMRLAADQHLAEARRLLEGFRDRLGDPLVDALLNEPQDLEAALGAQRQRVAMLLEALEGTEGEAARRLRSVADHLVRRSVWLVGGDGWAYDIGAGGLDHVLSTGRDVNILVLDTEVYSNTGGQASKSTPLGAVAKFAWSGKGVPKKDLFLQAISYGSVYAARVALGANPQQTLDAFREAEAWPGPSLILAYSPCIAHGIDLRDGPAQQWRAVHSGYWPLMRYNPALRGTGRPPLVLDSPRPDLPLEAFAREELRFRLLEQTNPEGAAELMEAAQEGVSRRWRLYEELASLIHG